MNSKQLLKLFNRVAPLDGGTKKVKCNNMDLGGLGGRTSRSPISCAALKAASHVSLRCRLGNFLLRKFAHQIVYAPPAQHYEPVFAVEVKGSPAPGAPMKWSLWSNNPTICQEEKTFCHALLLMKNNALLRSDNSSLCLFRQNYVVCTTSGSKNSTLLEVCPDFADLEPTMLFPFAFCLLKGSEGAPCLTTTFSNALLLFHAGDSSMHQFPSPENTCSSTFRQVFS